MHFKAVERSTSVFVDDRVVEDISCCRLLWPGMEGMEMRYNSKNIWRFLFCFVPAFFFLNLIITIISERWFKEVIALQIR